MILLIYLLLGACAGTIAGLFGVGGGLIIVPALIHTFQWQGLSSQVVTHLAIGTSLATIVVTSISSVLAHQRLGSVDWPVVARMSLGIVLGSILGAMTAGGLSGPQLQMALGLFVLFVSVQMASGYTASARRPLPGRFGLALAGTMVGWVSALFGIGGGSLTVPFLSWCNVVMQRAVAISAACGLPIAVMGSLTYMVEGSGVGELPAWSTGYVYWPAVGGIVLTSSLFARFGAGLAHRLPAIGLKRFFAVFLMLVGSKLVLGSGMIG